MRVDPELSVKLNYFNNWDKIVKDGDEYEAKRNKDREKPCQDVQDGCSTDMVRWRRRCDEIKASEHEKYVDGEPYYLRAWNYNVNEKIDKMNDAEKQIKWGEMYEKRR